MAFLKNELQILLPSLQSTRFEVFTAVKIQVEVFWVVTPCSVAVGHQRFGGGGLCSLHLYREAGGRKILRNDGILPQRFTALQNRRPRLQFTEHRLK